jgi:hypothetical protein
MFDIMNYRLYNSFGFFFAVGGAIVIVIVQLLDLILPMQSVPITTN